MGTVLFERTPSKLKILGGDCAQLFRSIAVSAASGNCSLVQPVAESTDL